MFYPSAIEPRTDHVFLDVLFEGEEAPHCEAVLIATPFITPEREVRIPVPTINSLLGDKHTAFAPRTIGILYNPLRKTDIAKQLFDVGALFDVATDLRVSPAVYAATHARQLVYANLANAADGLRIYDISNPAHPTRIAQNNNGGNGFGLALSGGNS